MSVNQVISIVVLIATPAAMTIALGQLVRRAKRPTWRWTAWGGLLFITCVCWLFLIPMARRTNDPIDEGMVYVFLIRWGPPLAAGWMFLQEMIATRERRVVLPGFPIP